jgi:hypothetical protein
MTMKMNRTFMAAVCFLANTAYAQIAPVVALPFVTHAAFFSKEMALPTILDPQVFVTDESEPAGRRWQGKEHVRGVRNSHEDDAAGTAIYNAKGAPLGMTLGQWLHAGGTVTLTPHNDGHEEVTMALHGLKPGGHYSVFENHFDQQPIGFTPVDGAGTANSFVADSNGAAVVKLTSPEQMTHQNAVLVVYHSDGTPHGNERGAIGETAHHQLIARVP